MKSTEKNTWQSRYCTTAAVVFITVTVIITIIGEEKAKQMQGLREGFIGTPFWADVWGRGLMGDEARKVDVVTRWC